MSYYYNNAQRITYTLRGTWNGHTGLACCPAHDDQRPSLSISYGYDGRLLLYCHAGCEFAEIVNALEAMGHITKHAFFDNADYNQECFFIEKNFKQLSCSKAKKNADKAKAIWKQAKPIKNSLAETYLRMRGIRCVLPTSLRFHEACPHPSRDCHPALVALVEGGNFFAIHRTYLRGDGAKADITPVKAMLGSVMGGAVHLSQGNKQHYVICEGIETGLSLISGLLPEEPIDLWAALSTSGMMKLNLPDTQARLTIAMDGDTAGRKAGFTLAARAHQQGFSVFMMEAPQGQDFNDVLLSQRGAA
ncbi:DUF7146 domain-containing protein [Bartonella sp. A05]|uniref:DUF7146 domain-containing protein n=1 Tax=Bartonella sp. A05 TaxID=2967261 RepID=UPI0022A9CE63|nr:toprim domain-containing protein [Bartonella sp. A05]MCZ2203319.1 toprim domain-containing protein [Bartonella sp. A05]